MPVHIAAGGAGFGDPDIVVVVRLRYRGSKAVAGGLMANQVATFDAVGGILFADTF